jgi:hypothetical protein
MSPDPHLPFSPYLITIPIIIVVLLLRMRSLSRERPLRIEWLWVTPVFLLAMGGLLIAQSPPSALQAAWMLLPFALGGAIGWYRGKMMRIAVDPQTHALSARASPAALYLIVAVIAIRYALNYFAQSQIQAWGVSTFYLTDLFMAFGVGMIGVQRVEMFLRAQRLLGEARAAVAEAAQTS